MHEMFADTPSVLARALTYLQQNPRDVHLRQGETCAPIRCS